ncbi:MAG: Asd/ArgC dimerization domain-containing protein [Candidatus Aenigmarchaeota archaeon]|nr:Asd/ArgC dimerization domain-containing protein [Candidatus Aenigmarchaeota archaeon]
MGNKKKNIAIVGATGAVGLEALRALEVHPWFTVTHLYASERSAGMLLRERVTDAPAYAANMKIEPIETDLIPALIPADIDVVFSALPAEEAKELEPKYARYFGVISTTAAFRYEPDVPILITEINPGHAELLRDQQNKRAWKGWIAPEPNCTTVGLVMSLKPIYGALGIRRVIMTSYQSVSGGGADKVQKWKEERAKMEELPDVLSSELIEKPELVFDGNVITLIPGEEEKVKKETLKILGKYKNGVIIPANFKIDCSCARVPTYKGHMEAVFVETKRSCSVEDVKSIYEKFNEDCRGNFGNLPASPEKTIYVLDREPQTRYDAGLDNEMATVIGRIEKGDGNWIKYFVLSNNLGKGAAKGAIQVMEYLATLGF